MKLKRILLLTLLLILPLPLTSCQVNWFGESYDAPWYVIAIPTLIFLCVALFIAGHCIAKKLYVCPKCGGEFHPLFWAAMLSVHINDDRLFKCPHCGHKGFCHGSRNNKN